MKSVLFIEYKLPEEFFGILGRYVTTCAYIEEAIFQIVLASELRPEGLHETLELKRNTSKLLKRLQKVGDTDDSEFCKDIRRLHERVNEGLVNRHHAVHGVWRFENDRFFVNYNHREGRGNDKGWVHWPGERTYEDLNFALKDADDILTETDRLIELASKQTNEK